MQDFRLQGFLAGKWLQHVSSKIYVSYLALCTNTWVTCTYFFRNHSTWHVKMTTGRYFAFCIFQTVTYFVLNEKCTLEETPASQSGLVVSRHASTLSWTQIGCVLWSTPGTICLRHTALMDASAHSQRIQPSSTHGWSWINTFSFFCLNVLPISSNTSSTVCLFKFLTVNTV